MTSAVPACKRLPHLGLGDCWFVNIMSHKRAGYFSRMKSKTRKLRLLQRSNKLYKVIYKVKVQYTDVKPILKEIKLLVYTTCQLQETGLKKKNVCITKVQVTVLACYSVVYLRRFSLSRTLTSLQLSSYNGLLVRVL